MEDRGKSSLTLEGEQQFSDSSSSVVGFQPLNHNKQTCKMFPNNNHEVGFHRHQSGSMFGRVTNPGPILHHAFLTWSDGIWKFLDSTDSTGKPLIRMDVSETFASNLLDLARTQWLLVGLICKVGPPACSTMFHPLQLRQPPVGFPSQSARGWLCNHMLPNP